MHYIGHRERLKKRLLESKRGTVATYELLEVLLFFVKPRSDVKPLAKELLNDFGSLFQILRANPEDLLSIKGIGESALYIFRCVQEILERALQEQIKDGPIINNWKKLINYLRYSIGHAPIEQTRILYLNSKLMLLNDDLQDVGTINNTPLYVREIIKRCLTLGATSLIIAHNHPSRNTKPSKEDIYVTHQIAQACKNIGVEVVDHIIISGNSDFSFKSEGIL